MNENGDPPLAHVLDLLLDAVCVVDAEGRFLAVSAAGERIFGYPPREMIGRPMIDFVCPEDRARTLEAVDDILAGQLKPLFENRYVHKDGRLVHIMWSARWSEADRVRIAVARDVSERKHAELMQAALYAISEAAHETPDLLALFRRLHDIVGTLLSATGFLVALYDRNQDRLSFPYHADPYDPAPVPQGLDSATLSAQVIRSAAPLLVSREASSVPAEHPEADAGSRCLDWLGVPLVTQKGIIGVLAVKSHVAHRRYAAKDTELLQFVSAQIAAAIERKQMESWLQHIARHDPLTDLPNRELVHDRLQTALARARREQTRLSLLYLDLDLFKQVNDGHGHAAGDLLLQEVARRLTRCVRESDTVARMGGDEFMVLLNATQLPEHAAAIAEKIRHAVGQPFDVAGRRLCVSLSIGIAVYPEHGDDYRQLIRQADEAMYGAKKAGGNRWQMAATSPSAPFPAAARRGPASAVGPACAEDRR
jgi:diguanylate cyclase (GGDEF)-like protein/PAS domain S-box-containing protein